MSKVIKDSELLAALIQFSQNQPNLPWAYKPLSPDTAYFLFLQDLGYLIARHFGGQFNGVGVPDGIEPLGYTLSFSWDFRIPSDGGFYADLDRDITIQDWRKEWSVEPSEFGKLI